MGKRLEEESKDLSTGVLATGLLVVHDTVGGGQHELTELTRGEQIGSELLDLVKGDVESGRDDTALVQATEEIDDNLSASVIVDDLEVTNVAYNKNGDAIQHHLHTVLLHDLEKLDDDLGAWANENL